MKRIKFKSFNLVMNFVGYLFLNKGILSEKSADFLILNKALKFFFYLIRLLKKEG